jgi:LPXTG-site transpeptidase (sortase) family protein
VTDREQLFPRLRVRTLVLSASVLLAACGSSVTTATGPDDGAASPATTAAESSSTTDAPATTVTDEAPLRPPVPDIPRSDGRLSSVLGAEQAPRPIAVRIDDLEIDAAVVPVGVEDDGLMEIPGASEVGWYRFGSTAGEEGSTVLAAHVDFNGRRGVFFDLRDIEEGAVVEVELEDGSVRRYEVVDNVDYLKEDLPLDDVFRREGDEVLTLITCGGAFDSVERAYEDNVVVRAVPIS